MQHGKKLCAFLLALCLVVGFIPASVFAAERQTEVVGQQLYLGDDLTMHFYVSVSDTHKADGVMNVATNDSSQDFVIQNMTANGDGNYVFSVELGAPQMTEDITLTLTSGGEKVLEKVYSIQDYAHYLLENNYTSETKALVKEMLNYGAKAQLYFDHNTTDLANEGYVIESAATIDTTSPEVVVSGAVDGIKFYGCSMVFESKIAIRYYFTAPNGIEGYTFTVDGNDAEPVSKSNMYYIEIDGIAPDAMDTLRTVKVAKDDAELSVQYSPVHYITRMYNRESTSQELKDLLVAAKGYFDAAKVFTGVAKTTLTIGAPQSFSNATTLYLNINVAPGVGLYENLAGFSNEETHVLIDDQAWTGTQEIRAFEGKNFYIDKIGAVEGTKITFKAGFTINVNGANYVTEQDYNYWFINGAWITAKDTLTITGLGAGNASILYFNINAATGVGDWANIASKCNEETHILIDDQAWSTQGIGGINGKSFYVEKLNAVAGTKLTIKEGFTAVFNGVAYTTDQDYTYYWNGSAWTKYDTLQITGMQSFSEKDTIYLNINTTPGVAIWNSMASICNEETHILLNDQAWSGAQEICAFDGKCFYIGKIGAVEGTKLTIKKGFAMTASGTTYVTDQDYNYWFINGAWIAAKDTLTITSLGAGNASILYFNINAATGVGDWADIASKCNEETHILIDDQSWSTQGIGGINGKSFYVEKLNAVAGTKLTIKEGFTAVFNGVAYVTEQDYNYWWNGTAWTTEEYKPDQTLVIGAPQSFSEKNTIYLNIDAAHGKSLYADMASMCNEESHILLNDQVWSGAQEICAFEGKCFYIGKIGAVEGTKLTIKAGFTMTVDGVNYVTAEDYNYWYTNGTWVATKDTLTIDGLGAGNASTVYFNINAATGVSDWTNIASKCNEETHILINDQAWSTQGIGGINGKSFYVEKLNAVAGTKLTIKEGFTAIFNGVAYTTNQDYNYWWDGSAWSGEVYVPTETLTIGAPQSFSEKNTIYLNINVAPGVGIYGDMAGISNEESYVLINDEAWSGAQEIRAFDGKCFYIGQIGAVEGTKITFKAGFTITVSGTNYVTEQDYNFWWINGAWIAAKDTLTINSLGTGTAAILYFNINTNTGKADWSDIASVCNEENFILINDQAWSGQAIGAINGPSFYINNIGATVGTKLTIKEGFAAIFNGIAYVTDREYNYWWDGSAWSGEVYVPTETLTIGAPQSFSEKDTIYMNINVNPGVGIYGDMAGISNEESYVLINDQAWNGAQEIRAFDGEAFYIGKIGAVEGTKVTIKAGFTITVSGTKYVTDKDYNFWFINGAWITAKDTLTITSLGAGNSGILYFNINTNTGKADWANIASVCNEENFVLVNGQAWSTQEIGAINGPSFYINNIGATAGTKLTIKEGFAAVFNGVAYVTDREYNYMWNGSAWALMDTLNILGTDPGTSNIMYLRINVSTGLSDWTNIASRANEETHILINDQAWNGQELGAINGPSFYVNNISGEYGTKVTFKQGFNVLFNGVVYETDKDYNFWWNGAGWVDQNPEVPEKIWKEMPLGVFGAPYSSQAAYDECADAGFNFVLVDENYGTIDSLAYKNILSYCIQSGMNPIAMTFNQNNTTDFSDIPGFAGKFFYDEPVASEFSTIASWIDSFEAQGYSNGIFLNNLFPSYAGESGYGADSYEEYLEGYIDQVLSKVNGPKWLSVDFYPLWMKTTGATNVHENYLYNLEATAQAALAHKDMDLTVHYFVQTHGFGDQEWNVRDLSSIADIRYQYNCAMAYGVNAFSVFTYPTQGGDYFASGNGLVTNNGDGTTTKNDAYYYVQQANSELKAWDEIYLSYDYEGTMAIGKTSAGENMANKLSHNLSSLSGTSVFTASNDTLIGQFDKNGSKAYMVSNYSNPANGETDTVIMNFANGTVLQVIINGVMEEVTVSNGRLVLTLGAGEAAFVIVK